MHNASLIACAALVATAGTVAAQDRLMVVNSTADVVMVFDPHDGMLLDPAFISGAITPTGWSTPKGIAQIDDEIWVSDQLQDAIYRFDMSGSFIAMVAAPAQGGGLDNIRGLNYIDGIVYQTNAGSNNSAPDDALVKFDTSGNNLGFIPTGDPFDVVGFNGGLLISNIASNSLDRYAFDGTFLGTFHSGAMRFPQQIAFKANGNLLVGCFSSPAGIYEIDPQGQQVGYIQASGVRGVYELGNGNIMYTNSSGVHIYDVVSMFSTQVSTGGTQYIALISEGTTPCYANCDASTTPPILNVDDFTCFINEFAAAQALPHEQQVTHYANCDESTTAPVLNVDDFTCFINEFAAGCD